MTLDLCGLCLRCSVGILKSLVVVHDVQNVNEPVPSKRHEMPRHLVTQVVCSLCNHEQDVQQVCENCGVCMGEYFCSTCKFFDDEVDIFSLQTLI
jgi:hypothetical protein